MDTTPEAITLMQLAKEQAGDVDLLLHESSLTEDTGYYKEMQAASHSVVDCLLEAFNKDRAEQFQKNFLVIAKACNTELQNLLSACLSENHLSQKKYEALSQANTFLQTKIISFIRQLQGFDSTNAKAITEHKS